MLLTASIRHCGSEVTTGSNSAVTAPLKVYWVAFFEFSTRFYFIKSGWIPAFRPLRTHLQTSSCIERVPQQWRQDCAWICYDRERKSIQTWRHDLTFLPMVMLVGMCVEVGKTVFIHIWWNRILYWALPEKNNLLPTRPLMSWSLSLSLSHTHKYPPLAHAHENVVPFCLRGINRGNKNIAT